MPMIREMKPEFWKCIDPDVDSARECAEMGVKLIVRHYGLWDNNGGFEVISPDVFVEQCAEQPWFPFAWAVETTNEPHPGHADYMAEAVQLLRARGKECVVGNWSTGWNGFYVPGATYYGCHEYGWPTLESQFPFHATRYESWFPAILEQNPGAKLFITEMGVTHAVVGGADVGWRSDGGPTADQYIRDLEWYAGPAPAYVLAGFLYQVGGFEDWSTFEILGSQLESWLIERNAAQKEKELTLDKTAIGNALGVIWGWTNALEIIQANQAVYEIRDAVRIIKEEVGKA